MKQYYAPEVLSAEAVRFETAMSGGPQPPAVHSFNDPTNDDTWTTGKDGKIVWNDPTHDDTIIK